MRMGEKTHFLISDYLHLLRSHLPTSEEIALLKEQIAEQMRQEFQSSKVKDYSQLTFDRRGGLSEHYYQEDVDDLLKPTIQKVHANLDALIASSRIPKLQGFFQQAQSIYIETPKNPDFEAMKVEIQKLPDFKDINIMASPDFWVIFHNQSYFILDRKSGKQPLDPLGSSDQIKVYALKLLLKTKGSPVLGDTKIHGYEVYLPSMQSYGGALTQGDIDDILHKINQDISFQKTFLIDQDASKNQPLSSTTFSRTLSLKKCENCSLRAVCELLKSFE